MIKYFLNSTIIAVSFHGPLVPLLMLPVSGCRHFFVSFAGAGMLVLCLMLFEAEPICWLRVSKYWIVAN